MWRQEHPSGGVGGVVVWLLPLLLLLLNLCVCNAAETVLPSRFAVGLLPPLLGTAAPAVRTLLKDLNGAEDTCPVVMFADHTPTAVTLVEGLSGGYAGGGIALLQLPASLGWNDGPSNSTAMLDRHLIQLMKMGRRQRYLNSCMSFLFVTDSTTVLEAMLQHSTDDRLMLWKNHAIIVTSLPESSALASAEKKWAFTMMNTHLLLLRGRNSAKVFRHEPYSPVGRRTRLVGFYSLQRGLVVTAPLIHEKFNNFHGAPVYFTALPYLPFIDVKEVTLPNGTKTFEFAGADYAIMTSISKKHNFKPTYLNGPTTWGQVTDEVIKRNAFICVCMYFMMLHRWEAYDFVASFTTKDLAFSMRQPEITDSWNGFLRPFLMDVWLFIFGILLIVVISLLVILKFSIADNVISTKLRGGQKFVGTVYQISKTRAVFELFGSLIGQDFVFRMPDTHSFRILITTWFLFIIVLSTGYKSKLISYMTIPQLPERPETVAELVQSNAMLSAPEWGRDYTTALAASSSANHRILAERTHDYVPDIMTGLNMAFTQGTAHMDDRRFQTFTIAEKFARLDGSSDFYLGQEYIISLIASLPIPHEAPYKPQFDAVMSDIVQAGLYSTWNDLEIEKLRISKAEEAARNPDDVALSQKAADSSPVKPLTVSQLQGPFWVMLVGSIVSSVTLLLEFTAAKFSR